MHIVTWLWLNDYSDKLRFDELCGGHSRLMPFNKEQLLGNNLWGYSSALVIALVITVF